MPFFSDACETMGMMRSLHQVQTMERGRVPLSVPRLIFEATPWISIKFVFRSLH